MNEATEKYWNGYWKGNPPQKNVIAGPFGFPGTPMADKLGALVMAGKKTATCWTYALHEQGNEPMQEAGDFYVVLDSKDEPLCIVRVTSVEVIPFKEVTPEFAAAEGEGDLSYEYWYEAHKWFFQEQGLEFSEDMRVVCERFELVDVK